MVRVAALKLCLRSDAGARVDLREHFYGPGDGLTSWGETTKAGEGAGACEE